jgi:hypothetical protein
VNVTVPDAAERVELTEVAQELGVIFAVIVAGVQVTEVTLGKVVH